MFDDWQSIVAVVGAILGAYAVVLWLGIVVWAYRDIRDRTGDVWSQTVAVLLVAVFNIPGLILYLLLRPHETLAEVYERKLETDAIKQEMTEQQRRCPTCQLRVEGEFLFCPHCRTSLREPCSACKRPLDAGWSVCPYCGVQGPEPAAAVAAGPPPLPQSAPTPPSEAGSSTQATPTTTPTPPSWRAGSSQ